MTVESETLKFYHKRLKSIIHLMVCCTISIMKKAEIWLTRGKKILFLDLDFPYLPCFCQKIIWLLTRCLIHHHQGICFIIKEVGKELMSISLTFLPYTLPRNRWIYRTERLSIKYRSVCRHTMPWVIELLFYMMKYLFWINNKIWKDGVAVYWDEKDWRRV